MTDPHFLSLVAGPANPLLWDRPLHELVSQQALQYEDHTAVQFPWQCMQMSYRQLAKQSEVMARALLSHRLKCGDFIAIMAGNCFQYLVAFLGAGRIGCPFVVLNNTYTLQEVSSALSLTARKAVLLAGNIGAKSLTSHLNYICKSRDLPQLRHVVALAGDVPSTKSLRNVTKYEDFLSAARHVHETDLEEAENRVMPDDILNLQFTSGTTGSPKAATLTHNNLLNNGRFVGDAMHLTRQDVIACSPPLFHCFGLVMGFLASFTHGSKLVFPCDQFDANQTLDVIYSEKCTALLEVPTMFVAMLEANKRRRRLINTVRTVLSLDRRYHPSSCCSLVMSLA